MKSATLSAYFVTSQGTKMGLAADAEMEGRDAISEVAAEAFTSPKTMQAPTRWRRVIVEAPMPVAPPIILEA